MNKDNLLKWLNPARFYKNPECSPNARWKKASLKSKFIDTFFFFFGVQDISNSITDTLQRHQFQLGATDIITLGIPFLIFHACFLLMFLPCILIYPFNHELKLNTQNTHSLIVSFLQVGIATLFFVMGAVILLTRSIFSAFVAIVFSTLVSPFIFIKHLYYKGLMRHYTSPENILTVEQLERATGLSIEVKLELEDNTVQADSIEAMGTSVAVVIQNDLEMVPIYGDFSVTLELDLASEVHRNFLLNAFKKNKHNVKQTTPERIHPLLQQLVNSAAIFYGFNNSPGTQPIIPEPLIPPDLQNHVSKTLGIPQFFPDPPPAECKDYVLQIPKIENTSSFITEY